MSMADPVSPLDIGLLVIAAGAWGVAIVAGFMLVRQRRAEISLWRLAFDGLRWFRRDTFRPEAAPTWRAFMAGWVVFMACVVAVALRTLLLV